MERRLSAILVADMVGYSRLMEIDELSTLERQKRHRSDLIDPLFAQFGGRIFKSTGDGLLAEFSSVVDAVTCAVSVQRAMVEREAEIPDETRIAYRVGINLGDVIHEDGDLHGDGVNVAARLEQMAEPGGICISGTAFDHLRTAVAVGYADMGKVQVKNIARPIQAWRVLLDPDKVGVVVGKPTGRRSYLPLIGTAVICLLLTVAGTYWWVGRADIVPADPAKYAFKLPEKPSVAVLALDNLTGDPGKDYIGDGLSENVITALAGDPKMFVIARNSSFHYKGAATPVQTIAEDLGVRYVLEGSVQSSGENIRVSAQLIDALSGHHLWSKTYDRQLSADNLFALQDELTREITLSVTGELIYGVDARAPLSRNTDLKTMQLMNEAIAEFQKFTPEGNARSETLLLEALKHSPNSAGVYLNLGWSTWYKIPLGQTDDPAGTMKKAREFAETSSKLAPGNAYTYALLGWLDMYSLDHDSAIRNAERAFEQSPGGGIAVSVAGWVLSASGQPRRGAELLRLGMRTEPFYPDWIPYALGRSLMMLGEYEEAKNFLEPLEAGNNSTVGRWARSSLCIIAVWEGDLKRAKRFAAKSMKLHADSSIASSLRYNYMIRDQAYLQRMLDALRTAGIPEDPPT